MNKMPFDWNEYLVLARELADTDGAVASEESKRRSAISRAYYSSYCSARNFLENMYGEVAPEHSSVHAFVVKALISKSEIELVQAGTKLDTLRQYRAKADYDNEVTGLKKHTELSIMYAEEIHDTINA